MTRAPGLKPRRDWDYQQATLGGEKKDGPLKKILQTYIDYSRFDAECSYIVVRQN